MPNWAEGVLKIRGKNEDVRRFVREGIEGQATLVWGEIDGKMQAVEKQYPVEIDEKEWRMDLTNPLGFYLKGSNRAFIQGTLLEIFLEGEGATEEVEFVGFRMAWKVDSEYFLEVAKEYNIDIKIVAFESGMQFNQHIQIINGELVKDLNIKYDDYFWDSTISSWGG